VVQPMCMRMRAAYGWWGPLEQGAGGEGLSVQRPHAVRLAAVRVLRDASVPVTQHGFAVAAAAAAVIGDGDHPNR
jgi:hypothetical protein